MTQMHSFASPFAPVPKRSLGAAAGKLARTAGKIGALGVLAPLTSLALLGMLEKKEQAGEKMTRGRDFEQAIREAPSLQQDRAMAAKHFRTLRRVAPDISKDPQLAAGMMKKMQAYVDKDDGGLDPTVIQSLMLRKEPTTMKKYDIASRTLPSTKVDVAAWDL